MKRLAFGAIWLSGFACSSSEADHGAGGGAGAGLGADSDTGDFQEGTPAGGGTGGSTGGASANGGSDGTSMGGTAAGATSSGGGASSGASDGVGGASVGGNSGVGAAGSGGSGGGGQAARVPVEQSAPALLTPRQEHAVTAFLGEVYVLGGFTPDNTASMEVFDPDSGTWRSAQAFPEGCHHPNLVGVGELLFVAGFHLGGDSPLRVGDPRTFAYDPVADSWTQRADMPEGTGRGASCVAALGTSIYVFGGSDDPSLATSSVYDTIEDSWSALPDLPRPRDHCFAATIDAKIYILAGRNGGISDIEPESWVFDPATESYEELAPIPTPRGGVAGGVIDGEIYIFGGEGNPNDPTAMFSEIEVYDPATNTWRALPPMEEPRHGLGGASLDGRIYLPGGGTVQGLGVVDTHSVFFLEPSQ